MKYIISILAFILFMTCPVYAADDYTTNEQYQEMVENATSKDNEKYVVWYGTWTYYDDYLMDTMTLYTEVKLYTYSMSSSSFERNPDYQYAILVGQGTQYNPKTRLYSAMYVPTVYYYDGESIKCSNTTSYNYSNSATTSSARFDNCFTYSGTMASGKELIGRCYSSSGVLKFANFDHSVVTVNTYGANVACFSSYADMEDYFKTGNKNNATFYPDSLRSTYYDLEVPLDFTVKYVQSIDDYFTFTWKQSNNEASKDWLVEIYRYTSFSYRYKNQMDLFDWFSSPWESCHNLFIGVYSVENRKKEYSLQFLSKDYEVAQDNYFASVGFEQGGTEINVDDVTFLVRNRFIDSDGKLHYSNWIKIEMFLSEDDIINISKVEIKGDGSSVDNNGNVSGDTIIDNGYTGDIQDALTGGAGADFIEYIKSGFGLLGDDGIIAMLSSTFSYLPPEFFVIILAGISIIVIIGIKKVVLG